MDFRRFSKPIEQFILLLSVFAIFMGCESNEQDEPNEPLSPAAEALANDSDREYVEFPTTTFEVPAGEEKFYCFTMTVPEDMDVDRFVYASKSVVHHMIVAETLSPEPEGFSECDVLFRPSWIPNNISDICGEPYFTLFPGSAAWPTA